MPLIRHVNSSTLLIFKVPFFACVCLAFAMASGAEEELSSIEHHARPRRRHSSRSRSPTRSAAFLAVKVMGDNISRASMSRVVTELSCMVVQAQRKTEKLIRSLDRVQDTLEDERQEAREKQIQLNNEIEKRDSIIANMCAPAITGTTIVRDACMRLAANQGGCAVCHEQLEVSDAILTATCLHPSHKKCGEKWRATRRRAQPGACDTCPGCASSVELGEWYTLCP